MSHPSEDNQTLSLISNSIAEKKALSRETSLARAAFKPSSATAVST